VLAPTLVFLYQPCLLQPALDPGVTAPATVTTVPGIKMLYVPAHMIPSVALDQPHSLIHRRPAMRYLGQTLVRQTIQPFIFIAIDYRRKVRSHTPKAVLPPPGSNSFSVNHCRPLQTASCAPPASTLSVSSVCLLGSRCKPDKSCATAMDSLLVTYLAAIQVLKNIPANGSILVNDVADDLQLLALG